MSSDGADGAVTFYEDIGGGTAKILRVASDMSTLWTITGDFSLGRDAPTGSAFDGTDILLCVAQNNGTTMRLVRYDSSGNQLWAQAWTDAGGAMAWEVAAMPGRVAVVGTSKDGSYVGATESARIISYSAAGDFQWTKKIELGAVNTLLSAAYDSCGNLWAAGWHTAGSNLRDACLFRLSPSGVLEHSIIIGGALTQSAKIIGVDRAGTVHVPLRNGSTNWLQRYDSNGSLVLDLNLGGFDAIQAIPDPEGGTVLTGTCGFRPCIARVDPGGSVQWEKTLDTTGNMIGGILSPVGEIISFGNGAFGTNNTLYKFCPPSIPDAGLNGACAGSPTPTPNLSLTKTGTRTLTSTASETVTPTTTRTATSSRTPTASPSLTESCTATESVTISPSPTDSPTPSITETASVSTTSTATQSSSVTPTISQTPTTEFSASPTLTFSVTFSPTGVVPPLNSSAVEGIRLVGLFPNPFKTSQSITVELGDAAEVRLQVFGLDGDLLHERAFALPRGKSSFKWEALGHSGAALSSGVYLLRLSFNHTGAKEIWVKSAIVR